MGEYRPDIEDVDDDRRIIRFNLGRPKKITGSRIASIVGLNEYESEFAVACDIAKLYKQPDTIFMKTGRILEPVIRDYLRDNVDRFIGNGLGPGTLSVEDPVPANDCGYEHFPDAAPFGGMVDGWVNVNGKHRAVLEIKTANDRDKWFGPKGEPIVPDNYVLQTSLYCDLSKLDKIVFVAAFLEEGDYESPEDWVPNEENTIVRIAEPVPMEGYKKQALEWYDRYIRKGITPQWTMDDTYIVDEILKSM